MTVSVNGYPGTRRGKQDRPASDRLSGSELAFMAPGGLILDKPPVMPPPEPPIMEPWEPEWFPPEAEPFPIVNPLLILGAAYVGFKLGKEFTELALEADTLNKGLHHQLPNYVDPDNWSVTKVPGGLFFDPAKWNHGVTSPWPPFEFEPSEVEEWWRDHQTTIPAEVPYEFDGEPSLPDWMADFRPFAEGLPSEADVGNAVPDSRFETFYHYSLGLDTFHNMQKAWAIETYWMKPGFPMEAPELLTTTRYVPVLEDYAPWWSRTGDPDLEGTERGPKTDETRPAPIEAQFPPPLPEIVLEPGLDPAPVVNVNVPPILKPPLPTPPDEGTKERKARMRYRGTTLGLVRNVAGEFTEFLDVLDAFYKAIPFHLRPGVYALHRRDGSVYYVKRWNPSIAQRVKAVWDHFDELDLWQLVKNVVRNELTDRAIGTFNQRLSRTYRQNPFYRRPVGLMAGPWDTLAQFLK